MGEVADFSQDHGSHAEPQPWDSGDRRMKLIHNGLDLLFDFINFTIQFTDEPDGVLQFKGLGRHLRANRVFGGISYFKSHIPFVVTIGGGFEQCFQPCQMGCSNLFSAGGTLPAKRRQRQCAEMEPAFPVLGTGYRQAGQWNFSVWHALFTLSKRYLVSDFNSSLWYAVSV